MTQILSQNENDSSIQMVIGWCKYALANRKASTGVKIGIVEVHNFWDVFLLKFWVILIRVVLNYQDISMLNYFAQILGQISAFF